MRFQPRVCVIFCPFLVSILFRRYIFQSKKEAKTNSLISHAVPTTFEEKENFLTFITHIRHLFNHHSLTQKR